MTIINKFKSPDLWLLVLILACAAVLASASGCSSAIERWQTSTNVLTAANNSVAAGLDEGRIKVEDAKVYRAVARVASDALDAWLATISPDGTTDVGSSRAAALAAIGKARTEFLKLLAQRK